MAWFLLTKNLVQLLNCTVNVALERKQQTQCGEIISEGAFPFVHLRFYERLHQFFILTFVNLSSKPHGVHMNKNDPSKTISIRYALEPELCCSASDQAILVLAGLE